MSTWNIYHKDGSKLTDVNGEQITVHGLEYSDSWMGECFLTISFKHEVPINFQIGDYIVYRGERFELNYEPGKDKQARPDAYGEGFVYDSVKFNALQDELSRAEFLDVVLNDNELHYTALPKFPFYVQTLDDLLDRIQANLDEQIGKGLWKIYSRNMERSLQRGALESEWMSMYGEGTSDNVIESMSITVDSQTCWQALALVNEKWDINFIVRGRNVYVGTTGIQAKHIFKYGLGNGLYEIVQNADSDQSVVTRLRAYGSEKNLPSHYYADLGVKYVANITKVVTASTNVELELDIDYIETYFKNKRKYVVSGESQEQSFGWVLQVTFDFQTVITGYVTQAYDSKKCRFYSELKGTQTDTGDEESKEKLDAFIAQVKAGNTKMYITSGLNKKVIPSSMKEYAENLPNNMSINRLMLPGFPHVSLSDFYNSLTETNKKYVNPTGKQHKFSTDPHRPYIDSVNIDQIGLRSASQFFDTDDKTNGIIEIYPTIEEMVIGGVRVDEIDEGVSPDDDGRFNDNENAKNVDIYLSKAVDFDINDLKDDDFSISMKDGMCGGRTFKVASATKVDGRWRLTIERIKDDALELWFPYKDYPIRKGDHFVLTGITLPDSYVNAASLKLLKYAIAYLDKNDYTRYVYQPKVDELFMARQHDQAHADDTGVIKSLHDTLKAGDLMEFEDTDLRIGGTISIDQLIIKEDDGKIPTYDITLREDKEVGTIQKIQQQISSLQSGNGGTGAGLTTTQVKNQVAAEGSKYFVSKITDDTAKGTITWEKVQKFLQGLAIGESGKHYIDKNGGASLSDVVVDRIHDAASTPSDRVIIGAQGFDLYMGDDGKSHMYLDNIVVRQKFFASSAEIRKISYSGGTTIFSNAGSTLAKVSVIFDADGNCIGYKCYACADDGTTRTMNWWRIGMMALCQTFNVKAGKNEKLQNRYYWRLVVGVGQEILDDGKLYDYVVLSNKEKFLGSESIVPTYANKLVTADGTNMLVFGDYGIEVSAAESMGSMAGILMKLEDKETDEGGNLIANRYFYGYESGIAQDAPAEGDVIVQVGDQICWKSRGNLIKISTSTEDNATDNAPAITMYHNLGALYSTGKKDSAGMEIISPYQWKTCTCVISPEQVKFNANNFMWFTEDPEKPFSPITVFYNIETNGMFRVGSSGRLYGDNVENGTAKVSVCCYKVMGDTKDVLDECWWESSCQDIKIDSPYTGRTDLQTNDAAAQNLPAYFTLDCYTLSVTADGTKHRGDVLLATMDIPVLKDGDKGEKGDKGDKGEQGEQGLRGLQGETGEQGIPGTPGKDGKTTYFHIKYSSEANPTTAAQMTETPNTYIGTYVDFLPNDSTDPNVYTWSRFEGLQGKDGTNGIPGKNGADGRTSYLHIKYSNDGGQTLTVNDGETPGSWIGQYTDYEQKDSTNVTKYTWSKIKGEQGDKGDDAVSYTVTLTRGSNGITQGLYVGVTRYIGTACTTGTIIDFGMSCKAYTDGTLAEGLTDRLQTSDNYIDFAAFPKAKSFTVELFDKNGNKVATGNYSSGDDAISILVEDAPLVFDTDDSGTVPASVTKTAKVKVMKGNTNVADDCTQLSSRDDLSSNCMCNVGKDEDNGCISVSVQGNWISKNDVIVDGVNQGKVSATSGYAVAQFVYAGVVYFAQVPFSVNVAKFTGSVVANNKKFETKFTEISNRFEKTPTNNDLTKAEARITQTAREISLSVSEKSVGRRNMLVGSACRKYGDGFVYMDGGYYDGYPLEQIEKNSGINGVNCIHCRTKQTGTDRYYLSGFSWRGTSLQGNIKLEKGKNYVLSFYAKTHTPNDIKFVAEVLYQGSKIDTSRPAGYAGPTGYSTTFAASEADKWELFTVKVSVPPAAQYEYVEINIFAMARSYSFVGGYICKPMLEEGENYNGWTLSEQDYDYVGGNLLDNARTLDKSGTLIESYDTVIQNGYGTDSACIKNLMKANATLSDYKEVLRWRFGSTYLVNGNDYIFSFVAKADVDDARVVCYMWSGDINISSDIFTEGNGGAWDSKSDGNIVFILSRQWTRYWVHWRPKDGYATPKEVIIRHTGNNSTSASTVYVTQPKLEIGATMTEWTERKTDLVDKASLKAAGIVVDSESVTLYGNQVHIKKNKTDTNDTVLIDNETGQVSAGLINAENVVAKGIKTQKLEAQNLNVTGNSRLGIFEIKTSSIDERDQYTIAGDMITYSGSYKLPDGKTDIFSADGLAYLMYKPLFIRQGAPENGRYMRLGNNYTEWDDCGTGNGDSYLFNGASARYVCSGSSNCTYYALPMNLTYNTGYFPVSYIYATKATRNDPAFAINVVKTKDSSDGTRTALQTNGAIRGVIAPNLRIMNYSGQISSSDCIVIVTKGGITLKLPAGPVVGQTLLIYSKVSSNVYIEYDSSGGYGTGKMYSDGSLQTKIEIGRAGTFTYFIFDGENWCYAYFNGSHRNA